MIVIKTLIWDEWNVAHIVRHDVTQKEIEEACTSDILILDGHKGRVVVLGLTASDRLIAVVLDPESQAGVYYPVTARSASRKERRYYIAEKGVYDKTA